MDIKKEIIKKRNDTKKKSHTSHIDDTPIFSYRAGTSRIHRLPSILKIFFLFALPIVIFMLPLKYISVLSLICIALSLYAGFSILQQLRDIRPILWYCFFLLCLHIFSLVILQKSNGTALIILIAKLLCSMQFTSLFFKTTTALSLQEALEKILPYRIAMTFSLFITFIPLLFAVWFKIERSWKARGGKNGVAKIFALLPVFLSAALYKAYNIFFTLQNRS